MPLTTQPVGAVQLSKNGYRSNPQDLDPARRLWRGGSASSWRYWSSRYDELSKTLLKGKITYGPQSNAATAKFGVDVASRFEEIAARVAASKDVPSLSLADLKILRDWKMIRNRARPSWLQVNSNSDSLVAASSSLAFSHLRSGDWRAALNSISALHGVGPATGSILLSLSDCDSPFYAEEAIRVAGVRDAGDYSMKNYEEYREKMNAKAEAINDKLEKGESRITPVSMERAIWAIVYAGGEQLEAEGEGEAEKGEEETSSGGGAKKKRKRAT